MANIDPLMRVPSDHLWINCQVVVPNVQLFLLVIQLGY